MTTSARPTPSQPTPTPKPSYPPTLTERLSDILQLRFTAIFAALSPAALADISPANPLKRLARVLGYAGLRLVGNIFRPINNRDDLRGKVWLYVVSANNYETLAFLAEARPDAVLVAGQGKNIGRYSQVVNRLSLRRKLLYYWQFPGALWGLWRQVGPRALRFFDFVFYAIGYYEVYRRALRHYRPRAVVFSNDHNDDTRSLLLACRAEGVPTAYVQHASVSTNFPPLGFDLSLLEGQDALDKYRQCGPIAGQVELVGMPKADAYLSRRNTAPAVRRVGLACNIHDPLPALTDTLAYLLRELPELTFTLRPHPSDGRDFGPLRQRLPGLHWSDARAENVFDFLLRQDALVAADTSTHLEATLLNVASIYYRFTANPLTDDYYGYAARGLVARADTPAALAAELRRLAAHKPADLYRRAAYYNATLGTPDEGQSQARAVKILVQWVDSTHALGLMAEIEQQLGRPLWWAPPSSSAQERFDYVLQHFALAYPAASPTTIGYAATSPPVEVADLSEAFFEDDNPYPAAPNFREWAGHRVPFFFDPNPAAPLLELLPGRAKINADLISAAFYLLSGWQEYCSNTRDRHGRFPYAASVQQQYGFVALPVVNYYFDVLKTAVEHVTGQPLKPRTWGSGAPFAAFVTHDIDQLHSAWKAPAKADLRAGRLLRFGRRLGQRLARPDAWDNLETVAATVAEYGGRSTFFILPEHRRDLGGTPNADYRLTPPLRQRLRQLQQQGHEIGLHASIGTATHLPSFLLEKENRLGLAAAGNRFHYLRYEPRQTPALLEAAVETGLQYDSTLGFAEHFGFRNSYCHPFYLFNFATGKAHSFLEIPLNVMDTTLHHPNYLQLNAADILPALRPMLAEVEKFGGVATVLWHNDHFDPANTVTGPRQFAELMNYLQASGAAFLTGSQILTEL